MHKLNFLIQLHVKQLAMALHNMTHTDQLEMGHTYMYMYSTCTHTFTYMLVICCT